MNATATQLRVHIRWTIRRDLAEVMAIEGASFNNPWTEADYLAHLRDRKTIGMVAEGPHATGGHSPIVGSFVYRLDERSISVLRLAVHPDCRHMGVGRQMVAKLADKLCHGRRTQLRLVDRESNLGGHLFWRAMGFEAVAVERGYYADTGEDGYRFAYTLGGHE